MKFKRTSITTIFECRLAKISIFIITFFQIFISISAQKYINHNEWHAQPSRRQAPKPIPLPVIPENQLEDMLFGTDFQETSEARAAPIYIGESPGQLPPGQENYAPQNSQPREEAYLNQQQPEYFPPEVPVHSPPPRPSPRPELQPPPSSYVPKATLEGIHWSQPKNSYPSQNPQPGCNGPNCFHIPSGVSYYSPQRNAVNQDKKRPVLVISNQVKGGQNVPQSRPHVEYNVAKGLPIVQSNANYPPPNPKPFESSYGGSWDEQSSQPPQHEPAYEQPNLPPSQNYGNAPARPPAYPPTHAPPQNYFATSEKNPYELEQPRQPPYPTPPAPPPINENPYAEVPTRPPESPYPQEQETPSPREQVTPSQPEYEQPGTPAGTPPPPRYETPRATTSQPGPTPPPVYETPTEGYEQTPPIPRTSTTPSPYVESYTTTTTPSPFVEEYATTTPPQTPPRATPASTTPRQYPSTTPPYQEFSEEYPRESTEYGTTTGGEYTPSSTPPPPEREFPSTPQRPRTGTPRTPGTPRVPYPSTSPPYAPPSTTQREFPSTRSEYPTTPPRFRTSSTTPFEETTPPYEEFTSSPPYYERTRPTPPFYPPSSPRPPSPRLPSPQPPGKPPSVFVPGKPFVPQIPPFHPMRPVPPPGLPPASVATPPYGGYTTYTPPPFEGRTPTRPRPSQPPHERMVVPNRIRGKAQVVCLENGIEFKISTLFPFTGQIFSHDKKRVPECMHNFEQSYNVSVTFPFLECGVPNSGEENLQTQYHMQIIVMIEQPDKSTSIQSFMAQCVEQKVKYKKKEIPKRIEEALEELRLVPQKLEQKAPIPEVKMKIVKEVEHHKEGDGEEVDTVEIGTPLRVEWNLQPESDAYGFHVRNCIVVDIVSGAEHKVIDDKGCSTDINIFAHPHYDTYHDIARVHWHAFKVPDNSQLSIRCDIQICTDIPDASGKTSCEAIPTPPFCADLITSPMNSVLFDVEGNMVKRHVEKTRDSSSFHQRVHAEICLGNATTTECERRNVETITQEIALPKITTIQTSCPQRIWMSIATGLSTSLFIFSAGLNLYVRRRKRVDQFNLK